MSLALVEGWFASHGWEPFSFQRDAWRAHSEGRSGLIHAPTGTGKTLAALFGPVIDWADSEEGRACQESGEAPPLRLLWITPMRALANDTYESLREPLGELGLAWTIEKRTGDTSSSAKARQRRSMPTALVTTPESLTILLSYAESAALLRGVRTVVVDEWHELLGSKRGVQTELALARMRTLAPGVRLWGLSATLGNIDEAARALVGIDAEEPMLIRGISPKAIEVESVRPAEIERFPWAGHFGTRLVDDVIARVERAGTSLVFTNTRSQAEAWFRGIVRRRPDLLGKVALHHGSLDREVRERVEAALRTRDFGLRCVVCTSSLDLGVDFSPVDQVIQIGSPKGIARLIQRAGRSGHQPGAVSRIACVPSHALELIEFASARDAIESSTIERRVPVPKPLDVLSQHLVTAAMGGGFDEAALKREVLGCHAYRGLSDDEWAWAMSFVHTGGETLGAYPDYARITREEGLWKVAGRRIATRHRMGIGTIVADAAVVLKFANGRVLGSIEEAFLSRLSPGERFVFGGRQLELVKLRQMTATVRPAKGHGKIPRWHGGKMPLSTQLADAVRRRLSDAGEGVFDGPEMEALRPLLELQARLSRLPRHDEVLVESIETQDGFHLFCFPFGGRLAHEGLGAVLSLRLSRRTPASITAVVNDYGIELVTDEPIRLDEAAWRDLLSPEGIVDDMLASVNESQMARRQFREVARIAGLTHQGYPGRAVSSRLLQASSDMFFDVFDQFDPGNLLLAQARHEVIEGQLEATRLRDVLDACGSRRLVLVEPETVTPLAFPLFAESLRATTVSSESWEDRVRKMAVRLEAEA
ncbi:MAG: ligase-associated DNA damage response DEXH box helicase [Phycisphaeraceae bacterium]|nr:MAG: ligase-associated DNA damage response DEXH box helicase [Phycisphaeraceae bacterium]